MANFNRVKFNDLCFSRDGADFSVPCYLAVPDLLPFRLAKSRNVFEALDGTPHVQLGELTGKRFSIRVETVRSVWLDELIDLLNSADTDQETITVEITGDTGNFVFSCLLVNFTSGGEFQLGYVAGVAIDLIVAEIVSSDAPN